VKIPSRFLFVFCCVCLFLFEFASLLLSGQTLPKLTIKDAAGFEGDKGTTPFVFSVILTPASTQIVTVRWGTNNRTATAPSGDFATGSGGTLTFNPGESSKTITVLVNGDLQPEPDEEFSVNLSEPVNATIRDMSGIGTIKNDDVQTKKKI